MTQFVAKFVRGQLPTAFAAALALFLTPAGALLAQEQRAALETTTGPEESVQRAAAIVNEDVISQYDIERRMGLVLASTGGVANDEQLERLRQQVIRSLVDEKLQLQEASENDISVEDEMLDSYFTRVAENFNQTPQQFENFLAENGTTRRAFEDQIKAELAWSQLVQRRLEPQVNIGDEEVEEVIRRLEESKGQFEYNLAEIFLSFTPQTEAQAYQTASQIVERVSQGAPFEAYARQFSEAATAAVGGDMGWVIEDQLSADMLVAVRDMRVNTITSPIRTPGGYQILMLKDRRRILSADPLDLQLAMQQMFWAAPEGSDEASREALARNIDSRLPRQLSCGDVPRLTTEFGATNSSVVGALRMRDLPPELREQLELLQPGQRSAPLTFASGVRVLVVCDRQEPQVETPTFDIVYSQLNQQRLSMMARRYLRDLRRDAIIDYR